MWTKYSRDEIWAQLDQEWDVIIIGGGITGAGILREACRSGLKAILFEQHDFSSGTSSRSSKLVHGGLRYLRNAQLSMTYHSVQERDRLLRQGRGLVSPLPFLMANYSQDAIPHWVFGLGLSLYDLLAGKWNHRHYSSAEILGLCPALSDENLVGGYRYFDAITDDSRLVLRLIGESVQSGGLAINYARIEGLMRMADGRVCGVMVKDVADESGGKALEVQGKVVVNATGAWADKIREKAGGISRLRILRGSHLIFSYKRVPLNRAITFLHPSDGRPVFLFPWEGVTVIGTTDVDHPLEVSTDIRMEGQEAEYLLAAVQFCFPDDGLGQNDVLASYSGVRAVLNTGKSDPSKESREHILWNENNLLTITGGKLTTFRLMAHNVLKVMQTMLSGSFNIYQGLRVLDPLAYETVSASDISPSARTRLTGRYGNKALDLVASAGPDELEPIQDLTALWAEVRWAARAEQVVHLDDLLMRRVRLGLLLPGGGGSEMGRIRSIIQSELDWDDIKWEHELTRYQQTREMYYSTNCK